MSQISLIFALLSAITASLVAIFGKIGLKQVDANTATAVRSIIMTIFLLLVVTLQGNLSKIHTITSDRKIFLYVILSGLAGATSWIFYFLALKFGKVAQVAPIDRLSVVFATILAVIFLGEKVSLLNGIGVGLIAIGAILVALG